MGLLDGVFEGLLLVLDGFFHFVAEVLQLVMAGQGLLGIAEAVPEEEGAEGEECGACEQERALSVVEQPCVAHGAGEPVGALVAAGGVLLGTFGKDGAQRAAAAGAEQLADGDAERVEVAARIGLGAAVLLGRCVALGAEQPRVLGVSFLDGPRGVEVDESVEAARARAGRLHDVGGLDVAVEDAVPVQEREALAERQEQAGGFFGRQVMLLLEPAGERLAGDEFFDDDGRAVFRAFLRVDDAGEDLAVEVLQRFIGEPGGVEVFSDEEGSALCLGGDRILHKGDRAVRGFLDDAQEMVAAFQIVCGELAGSFSCFVCFSCCHRFHPLLIFF